MANENKGLAGAIPAIGIGMDIANTVGGWFAIYIGKVKWLTIN